MTNPDQIIIPTSKKKLLRFSLTAAVFVAIGLWLIIHNPSVANPFFNNSYLKYSIGGLSVVFFGFILIYCLFKLADKKPGLVVDKISIVDNSSAVALGEIPWSDIQSIKTTKVWTEKFVTILLNDPQKYIDQQKNGLKRKTLKANFNKNGSPINISANSLKISHDELKELLEKSLSDYQKMQHA